MKNNAALSEVEREKLNQYAAQSNPTLIEQLCRIGLLDERFSAVPVYKNDKTGSDIRGSSFVVADRRLGKVHNF